MENDQDETGLKRQRNATNEGGPPHKRQRNELPNQLALGLPMKIIGLNDDCLIKIFNHLNLLNLFNVAIANEWLRPAAAYVYKRKFGTKRVIINGCDFICHVYSAPVESSNHIDIYGLKMALQYLRCFGPSIRDLSIDYSQSQSKRYQYVLDYISKYCEESLVNVSFSWLLENSMPHFNKQLINVASITVQHSNLGKQLLEFAESCSNVKNLKLYDVCLDRNFIAAAFMQLQDLTICAASCCSRFLVNRAYTKLLRMNPQLQSVELETSYIRGMTMETLLQMLKNNTAINKLIVTSNSMKYRVKLSAVQQLANEHPSIAELDLHQYEFTVDNVIAIIEQLSALKKIKFRMQNATDMEFHCLELETKLKDQWEVERRYVDPFRDPSSIQINRKN